VTTVGTSVVIACSALITALQADSVLAAAGVNISYDAPVVPEDLKSTDGDYEAIWIGDAEESEEIPLLTAGHLHRDETIDQVLVVQVLKPGSLGTQAAADTRAVEILTRVQDVLANNVDLSVTDPARFEAVLTRWKLHRGYLGNGQGHGARFDVTVQFTARLTPS
jgi:hypothetical protein